MPPAMMSPSEAVCGRANLTKGQPPPILSGVASVGTPPGAQYRPVQRAQAEREAR